MTVDWLASISTPGFKKTSLSVGLSCRKWQNRHFLYFRLALILIPVPVLHFSVVFLQSKAFFFAKHQLPAILADELVQLVKSVGVLPNSEIKVMQLHRTKATYSVVHGIGYHAIELLLEI